MGFAAPFAARIEPRNGVTRLALSGELDIATVPVLEDHLAHFEGDGVAAIMLDLREVTFLGCSALFAFLVARGRAETNGHRLILIGASQLVRRLFEVTDTRFLLDDQEAVSVLDRFTGGQGRRTAQTVAADV
jgi:anti-sigma B factor antagonist